MANIGVAQLLDEVLDPGSFVSWDFPDIGDPQLPGSVEAGRYLDELAMARKATGHQESVLVGEATVNGHRIAVILSDFDFLAGSVGIRACRLVVAAVERATEAGLPIFGSPASGGTRMQEGTPAFVLMADVAAAVTRHRSAGNAYLVWLRHPTTGGVMATWGSLGSVTFGEPGALAGFLGPRVYRMLTGDLFPADVQTTENLARVGVIDGVVDLAELRSLLAKLLAVVGPDAGRTGPPELALPDQDQGEDQVQGQDGALLSTVQSTPVWTRVENSRREERPGVLALLALADDVTRLSGTGDGQRSDAVVLALCRIGDIPVVVVGQDRVAQAGGVGLDAVALRTVRRGIRLADELGLPLVTVVDTAGAELSVEAEETAIAGEIARCLSDLSTLRSPSVSVLLGMGCGGGALALLPADRVLAAAQAWLSPLPLEGASVIRHRTPDRAAEMAELQRVDAFSLQRSGIVDVLIPEVPDAADEPSAFCARTLAAIGEQLADLNSTPADQRQSRKSARYGGGNR